MAAASRSRVPLGAIPFPGFLQNLAARRRHIWVSGGHPECLWLSEGASLALSARLSFPISFYSARPYVWVSALLSPLIFLFGPRSSQMVLNLWVAPP